MSREHSVSRRESLKSLGAAGAVLVLGGPAAAARQAEQKTTVSAQNTQPVNVADVATGRFLKGHS